MKIRAATRRWIPVARRDFQSSIRAWRLWFLPLVIVGTSIPAFSQRPYVEEYLGSSLAVAALQNPVVFFVAIGGVLLGYQAVASEIETGSITLTTAMPVTRLDVLLGKLVGRFLVLAVHITIAFVLVGGIGWYHIGSISISAFVGFYLLTLVYGLLNLSVGLSLSCVVSSGYRAGLGAFAYLLGMIGMWSHVLIPALYFQLGGERFGVYPPASDWLFFARRLSPRESFHVLGNYILGTGNSDSLAVQIARVSRESSSGLVYIADDAFDPVPWFFSPAVSGVIVLLWIVGSLGLGYVVLERRSLRR